MRNRQLWILATVLTAIGAGIFIYKLVWLDLPLEPEAQVTNWEIQAEINFDARGGPTKLVLFIPRNERPFTIMNQSFVSEGYGLTTTSAGDNRQATFSTREATGAQRLYYRFIVNRSTFAEPAARQPEPPTQKSELEGARLAAARGVLNTIVSESTDGETMVRLLISALNNPSPSNNLAALLGSSPTLLTRVRVARDILVLGGVRARMVTGIQLSNADRNAPLVHWIEAYVRGEWRGYALNTESFNVPSNYLPWWRGSGPLAYVEGGMALDTTLSVASASEAALRTALIVGQAKDRGLLDYSLFTLPLDTQLVYKIILTVPIGVFLLTILRNMVGIRTFGTFMPILIAIAFRETQVVWGVVLFTTVVAIGLLARLYLDNLRLLIVPRLASVLIIV
ncbi:MAG: UUP1 family membrane protein, partial [Pseudomonadota bacterium]